MKLVFKKVFVMLLLIIMFTTFNVNALSQEITIDKTIALSNYVSNLVIRYKKASTGEFIYCIDADKGAIYKGDTLKLDSEINDAGVIYLAKYGFPNKKMTGNDYKDYYITQAAVWWYYQTIYGITKEELNYLIKTDKKTEVINYIKELYNGAIDAHNKGITNPSLDVSYNNNLKLSSDGNYLESDLVNVNIIGNDKYTVNISNSNFVITDQDNVSKTEFNKDEKFKIRAKLSDISVDDINVNVKVISNSNVDKVYRYKPLVEGKQNALYSAIVNTDISLDKSISFNYKFQTVDISKVDITTKNELEGATLEVRDMNNNLIDHWVSTKETHRITLKPGNYKLIETIAPDGYQLSKEVINFTVYEDGTTSKITMVNVPITDLDVKQSVLIFGGLFLLVGLGMVLKNGKRKEY